MARKTTPQAQDLPATRRMLALVRDELKADNREFRAEMSARFAQVDARFNQVDVRFNQMDAKIERVASEVARLGTLLEEQNANNRIVLERLSGLWQRQERIELRVDGVEKLVRSMARPKA